MPARSRPSNNGRTVPPALLLLLLVAVVSIALWTIHRYRHRFVRTNADLLRLLPPTQESSFYADVLLLRKSGYLQLLAAKSTDADYRHFLEQTNFDFTRDLDAVAGTVSGSQLQVILRGRFDWSRFRTYVTRQNGQCTAESCVVPVSRPGQWLSFSEVQPDVMAAAVSAISDESVRLAHTPVHPASPPCSDPLWLQPANSVLLKPNGLPLGLRMFAIALQSAHSVTISLGSSTNSAFALKLAARFENPSMADTASKQLQIDTSLLKLELAREHAASNPADLTGLLTSGNFWTQGESLYGSWPVRKELLDSLR